MGCWTPPLVWMTATLEFLIKPVCHSLFDLCQPVRGRKGAADRFHIAPVSDLLQGRCKIDVKYPPDLKQFKIIQISYMAGIHDFPIDHIAANPV